MSYFIKTSHRGAVERILLGTGSGAGPLSKSKTHAADRGSRWAVRHLGQETVTVIARERDSDGRCGMSGPKTAHRNEWMVESENFFSGARARAAYNRA